MFKVSLSRSLPAALFTLSCSLASQAGPADMSFFVTSQGMGKGADLGGLIGADGHCQRLAAAAGAGQHTWHAYLSVSAVDGAPAINARDRIGPGPWQNARGVVIAGSVAQLHGDNLLDKASALDEYGATIKGRGDSPNQHDILTGSQADGTAFAPGEDRTCSNWTSSGEGAAQVGHHDRMGLRDDAPSRSWNSSHASRGCSQEALIGTGGAGLLYCFAVD
ncbi:hypothetical protein [Pseudomonas sp. MBLB4136]|uniref:hypothetical protein n=1 Tax=Pseudomonas sp. MBLB4136 TaxID=3451558 RepID=UPI003F754507